MATYADDIKRIAKDKDPKSGLGTAAARLGIGAQSFDMANEWAFYSGTTEEKRVYQNNDTTSENYVDVERFTSVTWKHSNGEVMKLPIEYDDA